MKKGQYVEGDVLSICIFLWMCTLLKDTFYRYLVADSLEFWMKKAKFKIDPLFTLGIDLINVTRWRYKYGSFAISGWKKRMRYKKRIVKQRDTSNSIDLISPNQLYIYQAVSIYEFNWLMVQTGEFSSSTSDIFVISYQTRYDALISGTGTKYVCFYTRLTILYKIPIRIS
jgi:hypothetical protein